LKKHAQVSPTKRALIFLVTITLLIDLAVAMRYDSSPLRLLHTYTACVLVGGMLIWSLDLVWDDLDRSRTAAGPSRASILFVVAAAGTFGWMIGMVSSQNDEWKRHTKTLLAGRGVTAFAKVDWRELDPAALLPCEIDVWDTPGVNVTFAEKPFAPHPACV